MKLTSILRLFQLTAQETGDSGSYGNNWQLLIDYYTECLKNQRKISTGSS